MHQTYRYVGNGSSEAHAYVLLGVNSHVTSLKRLQPCVEFIGLRYCRADNPQMATTRHQSRPCLYPLTCSSPIKFCTGKCSYVALAVCWDVELRKACVVTKGRNKPPGNLGTTPRLGQAHLLALKRRHLEHRIAPHLAVSSTLVKYLELAREGVVGRVLPAHLTSTREKKVGRREDCVEGHSTSA